jgi:hypothetical protein
VSSRGLIFPRINLRRIAAPGGAADLFDLPNHPLITAFYYDNGFYYINNHRPSFKSNSVFHSLLSTQRSSLRPSPSPPQSRVIPTSSSNPHFTTLFYKDVYAPLTGHPPPVRLVRECRCPTHTEYHARRRGSRRPEKRLVVLSPLNWTIKVDDMSTLRLRLSINCPHSSEMKISECYIK